MGYRFNSSGKPGIDLVIPTKKGLEEGGMPKGVIIPIGYKYLREVRKYIDEANASEDRNVYIAKHCDNENILTHIVPDGIVNRFGWYVTRMDILSVKPNWCLDVGGPGWFKRVTVSNISEIEKFL